MRLLHTKKLEFEEFFDSNIPSYAILSHRWEKKEMSFQDFQNDERGEHPGFKKIQASCSMATKWDYQWVWIDTCCIDKKSSAELTEAINSMYNWYHRAEECYVYLSDVTWRKSGATKVTPAMRAQSLEEFRKSAWFTRGWTLQELLAPSRVIFFDRNWRRFGSKRSLAEEISHITGIDRMHLEYPYKACIAVKMSWASRRTTSRLEDLSYCLLGLFDVNMPLLYGEGNKAFLRLQMEIIKHSDDESIFAWMTDVNETNVGYDTIWDEICEDSHRKQMHGILASRPSYFAHSGDISIGRGFDPYEMVEKAPYSMTNKGLEFHVLKQNIDIEEGKMTCTFNCFNGNRKACPAIEVKLCKYKGRWHRVDCGKLLLSSKFTLSNKHPVGRAEDYVVAYAFQPVK